jgi:DNA-binding GntR family transcriptional regulator
MTQAHARNDIPAGLRGTAQFYEVLFAGAGNEVIAATLRPLSGRIYLLRARSMSFPGRRAEALQEMHEILDAALGENPVLAWDRCHMHVQNACRYAIQSLEQEAKGPDRKSSRRTKATSRHPPTDASRIIAARPPR